MIPPVVDQNDLEKLRRHADLVLADVRFYLDGSSPGEAYRSAHLPGAVFVDLEQWLAAPGSPQEGRHPLPDPDLFAEGMSAVGIGDHSTVVAYDDAGGTRAARLVWMLRAIGHEAALLDGGISAWEGETESGDEERATRDFTSKPWPRELIATIDEVSALDDETQVLLDARSYDRYCGDDTTGLDPKAGHIPGARNLPVAEHLDGTGRLLPADQLRKRFASVGVTADGPEVISSCGSGVSACHNLVLMEHLGLPAGRLYPGSWSQWSNTDRPTVTGESPR